MGSSSPRFCQDTWYTCFHAFICRQGLGTSYWDYVFHKVIQHFTLLMLKRFFFFIVCKLGWNQHTFLAKNTVFGCPAVRSVVSRQTHLSVWFHCMNFSVCVPLLVLEEIRYYCWCRCTDIYRSCCFLGRKKVCWNDLLKPGAELLHPMRDSGEAKVGVQGGDDLVYSLQNIATKGKISFSTEFE